MFWYSLSFLHGEQEKETQMKQELVQIIYRMDHSPSHSFRRLLSDRRSENWISSDERRASRFENDKFAIWLGSSGGGGHFKIKSESRYQHIILTSNALQASFSIRLSTSRKLLLPEFQNSKTTDGDDGTLVSPSGLWGSN